MDKVDNSDNSDDYDVVSNDSSSIEITSRDEEINMALVEMDISDKYEHDSEIQRLPIEVEPLSINNIHVSKNEEENEDGLKELREDYLSMPSLCPERIVMELIELVERKQLLNKETSDKQMESFDFIKKLDVLESALSKQDLLKYNTLPTIRYVKMNADSINIIKYLRVILSEIRPVNFREIQRLMNKARSATQQIKDLDIVLLIGETGSGKSTTIQFLSGCNMIQTKVEIVPGRDLLRIEPDEQTRHFCSKNISSVDKSSTKRYFAAQHVPLERIFGCNRSDFITLCEAPTFDDTTDGVEVDVANSVGVCQALSGCKS